MYSFFSTYLPHVWIKVLYPWIAVAGFVSFQQMAHVFQLESRTGLVHRKFFVLEAGDSLLLNVILSVWLLDFISHKPSKKKKTVGAIKLLFPLISFYEPSYYFKH